jgi:glycosyltransferase involved in cell wall biosynthesis
MRLNLVVARRTVRRARLILAPSNHAAAEIERVLGITRERIRVTPEAAPEHYQPAPAPDQVRAELQARFGVLGRYVFNVGGLDVRKNLPTLLEAWARVVARLEEPIELLIAGSAHSDNPAVFPPLAPMIERLGLEDNVRLLGRIDEATKLALYQCAALYVTPSLYEGFGLTALEAMACGAPTIAANRTSLPEVVGDGGLLVEPQTEPLAAAIIDVLTDAALAATLGQKGQARARCFSWAETARLTVAAYHEAMEPAASARRLEGEGDGPATR